MRKIYWYDKIFVKEGGEKMKKRVFSLVLALLMLMNIVALMPTANAATFSDVPDNHWAKSYIEEMQGSNIINGYGDGTFKPEKEVKVGEFIKILCVKVFPDFKYIPPEDGSNWSRPYVEALDGVLLKARDYNDAIVSRAQQFLYQIKVLKKNHLEEIEKLKDDHKVELEKAKASAETEKQTAVREAVEAKAAEKDVTINSCKTIPGGAG